MLGDFGPMESSQGHVFLVNYMTSSFDPTRQYFGSQYFCILRQNTRFQSR